MIKTEAVGVDEALKLFGPRIVNPALRRTVNDGARRLRSEASQTIRQTYQVKAGAITRALKIRAARGSALEAVVLGDSRSIPLIDFGASKTRKGVSVRVKRGSAKRRIPGTFIATMDSGRRGVFRRGSAGDNRRRRKPVPRREERENVWGSTELPIDQLLGPSVGHMLTGQDVLDGLLGDLDQHLPVVFSRELRFRIEREISRAETAGTLGR